MVPRGKFVFGSLFAIIIGLGVCESSSRFILGFMKNRNADKALSIHLLNPMKTEPANVIIQSLYTPVSNITLQPQGDIMHKLPSILEVTEDGRSNKGILISSSQELVVTGINRVDFMTYSYADSFQAIPESSLGHQYYAVTAQDLAEILVVGGYKDTAVTITVQGKIKYKGDMYETGESFTEILDAFDTLLIHADSHNLTGTQITSDKIVSVYSGNDYMSVGSSNHLVQQLSPVSNWGNGHALVPPSNTKYDVMFVAALPNTTISIKCYNPELDEDIVLENTGASSSRFMAGSYCVTSSSSPVSVTMLVRSVVFDPVMIRMQPVNSIRGLVFLVAPEFETEIVLAGHIEDLTIDDSSIPMNSMVTGNTHYSHVRVSRGYHKIKCKSKCLLTAYIHGYLSREAIGYPVDVIIYDDETTLDSEQSTTTSSTQTPSADSTSSDTRESVTTTTEIMESTGTQTPRHGIATTEVTTQETSTTTDFLNKTCMCQLNPCKTSNYSRAELKNLVAELKQKLLVKKRATSNHKRKLSSAPDHRTSSKVVGYIAGSILGILAVGLLIIDIPNLCCMFSTIKRNISS